jgi:hypothetical protein
MWNQVFSLHFGLVMDGSGIGSVADPGCLSKGHRIRFRNTGYMYYKSVQSTVPDPVAYPGGMHRMHVNPPSPPPPVHPPPAMCIPPPSLKG